MYTVRPSTRASWPWEELSDKYFIVRIAWVFGVAGKNFIKTMLRLGKERGAVSVVDDQIGSPTYTYDLARLLVDMIQTDKYGRYHATNEGLCSWYEFARNLPSGRYGCAGYSRSAVTRSRAKATVRPTAV